MSVNPITFTKENIDLYLKELAKQFRKLNGAQMPAEMILIGGASILINYGFRDSTSDIDALIRASSAMKDAIGYVSDKMDLPAGWINEDFRHTKSYSPYLIKYSKPYRQYSNVLHIRTITAEYLVAMKLMAYRQYKHDISDVVGILRDQQKAGDPLTFERIDTAVRNLYDGWENLPGEAQTMIQGILATEDLDELYASYAWEEQAAKEALLDFEGEYPDVLKEDNLGDILSHLMKRQEEQSEGQTFG